LLIFSLMVTPAAIAKYLSRRPQVAILISVVIALSAVWLGLFLAFYTPYPVSFFISALVFGLYVIVRVLKAVIKPRKLAADETQMLVAVPQRI
jgi:zinc/manganese transport system permease protein